MVEQLGQQHTAQFAGRSVVGAGVINHSRLGTGLDQNHRVPGRGLAELAEEEQVAGLGLAHVAADQVCVALDQGSGVGKLGKGAVSCVGGLKTARPHPEERRA
jgi:hypothetical protein